ncbi:inactive pancreatic lipase-related protein 1-like [Lycorma delicatula]|uniref:inactive pancreatic lipase-related protein 1-like n=1 Tax=Lycorma delicatula TaxID=130591 RepID=UPI003F50FF30
MLFKVRFFYQKAFHAELQQQLLWDIQAEKNRKCHSAFSSQLHPSKHWQPPDNKTWKRWLECGMVPEQLVAFSLVFGGTTNLKQNHGKNRTLIKSRPKISLKATDFNDDHWTVFLTHGFYSDAGNHSWIRDLEEAILMKSDANVITCDWSKGSRQMNYIQVAANTRVVGAEIARIINYLLKNKLATKNKIHMIGQSLGAHVMSYAAANITSIARLTGLDPAQPGFEKAHPSTCLDPTDAQFVDVIHTNAKPFLSNLGLGIMQPVGHIDFYVNGGGFQPGCYDSLRKYLAQYANLMDILAAPFTVIADYLACSHRRAYQYYTESLRYTCSFWARKWKISQAPPTQYSCTPKMCQEMGKFTGLLPGRGSFYIHTNPTSPFCIWDLESEYNMRYYLDEISNKAAITDLYE